jgi:hypothetical protein
VLVAVLTQRSGGRKQREQRGGPCPWEGEEKTLFPLATGQAVDKGGTGQRAKLWAVRPWVLADEDINTSATIISSIGILGPIT